MSNKNIFSEQDLNKVKELFHQGYGKDYIAKCLNKTGYFVAQCYTILGLGQNTVRKVPRKSRPKVFYIEKLCEGCGNIKPAADFRTIKEHNCNTLCKECEKEDNKKRYYDTSTPELRKQYRQNRIEKRREWERNRHKNDINYRLKKQVSHSIRLSLNSRKLSKNGQSTIDYLPYTMDELKQHIEKQFKEPDNEWMTWDNWGVYRYDEWDDDDQSTWKWQLDHRDPHSEFPYTSMKDPLFKECWALNNLRPLSAQQNQKDGATKVRHNKKSK